MILPLLNIEKQAAIKCNTAQKKFQNLSLPVHTVVTFNLLRYEFRVYMHYITLHCAMASYLQKCLLPQIYRHIEESGISFYHLQYDCNFSPLLLV